MNIIKTLPFIFLFTSNFAYALHCSNEKFQSSVENVKTIHVLYDQNKNCQEQMNKARKLKGRILKTLELAIDFKFKSSPIDIVLENKDFIPYYDKNGKIYLPFSMVMNQKEIMDKERQAIILHEYAQHVLQRQLEDILFSEKYDLKNSKNKNIEDYKILFADYFAALILDQKAIFNEIIHDEDRSFGPTTPSLGVNSTSNVDKNLLIARKWLGKEMWTGRYYGKIPYLQKVLTAIVSEITQSLSRKDQKYKEKSLLLIKEIESIDILDKKLTPDWSVEYTGNDLVKIELKKNDVKSIIPVTIIDSGFTREAINVSSQVRVDSKTHRNRNVKDLHGTNVANVLNHHRFGGSDNVQFNLLAKALYDYNYDYILEESLSYKPNTRIISNSLGWRTDSVAQVANKANEKGILWFLASGNDFPKRVNPWESSSKAILVGSYSPSGLVTHSTQIDENVVILAPADHYQQTINAHNEVSSFGETSGATPLVSASVANWLSIYSSLQRDDVIRILQGTALKTLQNGETLPGQLNAFKGLAVVEDLKSLCPEEKRECLEENLTLLISKKRQYPYEAKCSSSIRSNTFLDQRRAYFLDEENMEVLKLLKCGYEKAGYTKNSEYFELKIKIRESINSVIEHINEMAIASVKGGISNAPYYRNISILGDEFIYTLKDIETNDYGVGSYFASELIARYVQEQSKKYLMTEFGIPGNRVEKFFRHTNEENVHY